MGLLEKFSGVFRPMNEDIEKIKKERQEMGLNPDQATPTEQKFSDATEKLQKAKEEEDKEREVKEAA